MIEKPILFSTPMVKAILDGQKTQTRRTIPEKIVDKYYEYDDWCRSVGSCGLPTERLWEKDVFTQKARWQIGDILWVRETFIKTLSIDDKIHYEYRADYSDIMADEVVWRPSIFMPREACRIKLLVKNVRVERLNDITNEDAIAEGIDMNNTACIEPMNAFAILWESINGKGSWANNPWVWVIEFETT